MTLENFIEIRVGTLHLLEDAVEYTRDTNGNGAINRAAYDGRYDSATQMLAHHILEGLVQPGWWNLDQWMNARWRTREEVVALFHKAINQLREA